MRFSLFIAGVLVLAMLPAVATPCEVVVDPIGDVWRLLPSESGVGNDSPVDIERLFLGIESEVLHVRLVVPGLAQSPGDGVVEGAIYDVRWTDKEPEGSNYFGVTAVRVGSEWRFFRADPMIGPPRRWEPTDGVVDPAEGTIEWSVPIGSVPYSTSRVHNVTATAFTYAGHWDPKFDDAAVAVTFDTTVPAQQQYGPSVDLDRSC